MTQGGLAFTTKKAKPISLVFHVNKIHVSIGVLAIDFPCAPRAYFRVLRFSSSKSTHIGAPYI